MLHVPVIVENSNVKVIHYSVQCDGCKVSPVVGIRYKCTICNNFDYCEKCEATKEHVHSFIKIKTSSNSFKPEDKK